MDHGSQKTELGGRGSGERGRQAEGEHKGSGDKVQNRAKVQNERSAPVHVHLFHKDAH